MSVLVCPVCQGSMKEVAKNGVLIDTCTQCRGVWLDRGELEKLSSLVTDDQPRGFLGDATRTDRADTRRRDYDDDDDRRHRSGGYPQKRKSFLEFFD